MSVPARPIAAALVAAVACVALAGCSAGAVEHAGRVVDDSVTLRAPAIAMPVVSLDAGFSPGSPGAGGGVVSPQRSTVATAVALTGLGSVVRVASVSVRPGDTVHAGQRIARLDDAALVANVAVAKAGLSSARAQVAVLDDALDSVASGRLTLAAARAQINSAAALLTSTRAKLVVQLAALKALLARVEALGAGGGPPTTPPGGVPTGTVPPGGTPPPGALPDPAILRAGIAKLTAALAQIDAGLIKVGAGRAKLASASAKLTDARRQLRDLRRLALVGVDGAKIGVRLAEYQRSVVILRSPVDGTVVSVASVGDVLAPGATVAQLRRSGAPRVTTWLAPGDLGSVAVGTKVEVRADWFPAGLGGSPIEGRVSSIGTRAEYPPTSFATDEIHLTRAVRIEMTLSDNADQPALPPGMPVDVRFVPE